ncbi:MAG TPA: hypothetical protein VJ831_15290, partial [Jatrophihabitantaceae bacterium]|nr:hypothetical protein [Jatrophihabitantaceae bacterium]
MRRAFAFSLLGVGLLFALAAPVRADNYGTTTTSSTTSTTVDQQPQASVGSADPTNVNPGDTVTFNSGDALGNCTSANVFFVRALQNATGDEIRTGVPVSNGSVTVQFQVPQVPAGIYFVYASCTDSGGNVLQALGVVVVFTAESPPGAGPAQVSATDAGGAGQTAPAPQAAVAPPAAIAAMQTTPDNEHSLMAGASVPGSTLAVINGQLAVSQRVPDKAGAATAVPALALVLAALGVLGLVALGFRRR